MSRLMSGRSTSVISHKLLTIRDAIKIVVTDGGRVVEEATHEELLERNGYCARLTRCTK